MSQKLEKMNHPPTVKRLLLACGIALAISLSAVAQEESELPLEKQTHTWVDSTGKNETEAILVEYANKVVKLQKSDGEVIEVPYNKLNSKSKSLAKKLQRRIDKAEKAAKDDSSDNKKSKKSKKDKEAVEAGPIDPNCPRCHGTGLVGTKKFQPLVMRTEKEFKNANSHAIGDSCPICQKGVDPLTNSGPYHADPDALLEHHKEWCEKLGLPLQMIQTRFLVIHSELPPQQSATVARAIEGFEWQQQRTFGSMFFSLRRRAHSELFILGSQRSYSHFIDVRTKDLNDGRDWENTKKLASSSIGSMVFQKKQDTLEQTVSTAVYGSASAEIRLASGGRSIPWLQIGYAAHFEKAVTNTNLCFMAGTKKYDDEYGDQANGGKLQFRNFDFTQNWDAGIRQMARANRVLPWLRVMETKVVDYQVIHDLQVKSMAGFLIQQPEKFTEMVTLLSAGTDQVEALEEAYGKKLPEIEKDWVKWLGG